MLELGLGFFVGLSVRVMGCRGVVLGFVLGFG